MLINRALASVILGEKCGKTFVRGRRPLLILRRSCWPEEIHRRNGYEKGVNRIIFEPEYRPITMTTGKNGNDNRLPATLSRQDNLQRLPLPALADTLDRYLATVRPHLTEDEFAATQAVVADFGRRDGVGAKLQRVLEQRWQVTANWFSDWWLEMAYLGARDPVTVWSSPGVIWPNQRFSNRRDWLAFASGVVCAAVDFKLKLLDGGLLPVESQAGKPVDMEQYYRLFNTCRLPDKPMDKLAFHHVPGKSLSSEHIIVMHNGNIFKIDITDCLDTVDLLPGTVFNSLQAIVKHAEEHRPGPGLGLLTSQNRDIWAANFNELQALGNNNNHLKDIEISLFVLNLDCSLDGLAEKNSYTRTGQVALHGGGQRVSGHNRWFDKTLQFFVAESGECGMSLEHSPAEGGPALKVTDHILDWIGNNGLDNDNNLSGAPDRSHLLTFNLSDSLTQALRKAGQDLEALADRVDLFVLIFDVFGKEAIKEIGFSPDSFIQIAIQTAFYRLHSMPAAQYESASTRQFTHGRTEVIRTCSQESTRFAKLLPLSSASQVVVTGGGCSANNLNLSKMTFDLMKSAIAAHNRYAREAVQGRGVDRHLQGLRRAAQDLIAAGNSDLGQLPAMFEDKGFKVSSRMRLSTSQVSGKHAGCLCFPPLVEDGYACCYNIRGQDLYMSCSSLKDSEDTVTAREFAETLKDTLEAMMTLGRKFGLNNNSKL